jgi:hypothetical protein
MLSDSRPGSGRVPVALYIATPGSDAEAAYLMRHCRNYAAARHWTATLAIADSDPAAPLADRPGWQQVTAALSDRTAQGVVTWQRAMLAHGPTEYEALAALVADRGGFVAVAADGGTRHTPGETARRQALGDAAAGCHPDSPQHPDPAAHYGAPDGGDWFYPEAER